MSSLRLCDLRVTREGSNRRKFSMFEEIVYMLAQVASSRIRLVMRPRPSRCLPFLSLSLYLHHRLADNHYYGSSSPFIIFYYVSGMRHRGVHRRFRLRFITSESSKGPLVKKNKNKKIKNRLEKRKPPHASINRVSIDQIIATHVRY